MKTAIVQFPSNYSFTTYDIRGTILFQQQTKSSSVLVTVELAGLPPGVHGFHIHEKGLNSKMMQNKKIDICKQLGGHFNPFNTTHGSYKYNTVRHAGDLINNLNVSKNGTVTVQFLDSLISLYSDDINCVINRSIVIHDDMDDEGLPGLKALQQSYSLTEHEKESLKTGNAGNRIACGNILLQS